LVVKNLPQLIQESRLRETFSKYGSIQTLRLTRGSPKIVAFISFFSEIEAFRAMQNLNGEQI